MNAGSRSGAGSALLQGAELIELSPFDVDAGERIGFTHEDKAAALGRLMAVDGQRDPIKVVRAGKDVEKLVAEGKKPWRLVTGMHRLLGARIESLTVFAIEVSGKPEDLADLEASENLHRRPLGPIERAKFVQALCQAAQERIAREHGDLSQQKLGIKLRWERVRQAEITADKALREEADDTALKMSAVCGWQESVADALNLGKATIRRSLRLYRLLIEPFPELIEALAKHPVVGESDSQLREIADFGAFGDDAARRRLIEAVLADEELSVAGAKALIGARSGAAQSPRRDLEKLTNAITGNWGRLSVSDANRFVREKLPSLLTPGQKRELHGVLSDEMGSDLGSPRKVGIAQASDTLSLAIDIANRLIDGGGVEDEELDELRRRAQRVVFDIPEEPAHEG